MALTEDDRKEIAAIVAKALNDDFFRQRALRKEERERTEAAKETHLYLITLTGHQLAIPDENGRAVLTQCVYARVSLNPANPGFWGGSMEVIAQGDGRLLKQPVKLTLTSTGVVALVQVDESILKP